MAQRASTNDQRLIKAPIAKDELVSFAVGRLELGPDCSILDLDNPLVITQPLYEAQLGIWIDTWHEWACRLGTCEDAMIGVTRARAFLGEVADHVEYLLFSADFTLPPLDQLKKGERLLFEQSTGLVVKELATYKGRILYVGSRKRK